MTENAAPAAPQKEVTIMDYQKIVELLPHRYPFLLIDRVIEFVDGEKLTAIKNVSANEEFFQGHFPGRPVMPGVLILEAMAQAGALYIKHSPTLGVGKDAVAMLVAAENVRWRRQVVPGDVLRIEMSVIKRKGPLFIMGGKAVVGDQEAASAQISAMMVK